MSMPAVREWDTGRGRLAIEQAHAVAVERLDMRGGFAEDRFTVRVLAAGGHALEVYSGPSEETADAIYDEVVDWLARHSRDEPVVYSSETPRT